MIGLQLIDRTSGHEANLAIRDNDGQVDEPVRRSFPERALLLSLRLCDDIHAFDDGELIGMLHHGLTHFEKYILSLGSEQLTLLVPYAAISPIVHRCW